MEEALAESMAATSFIMVLLAIATGVAVFLSAIGLFGVISYVVGQRTREIGVRVALGARSEEVSRMVVRQALVVTLVGAGMGLAGAFGLTRLMGALLYEVSATNPATFVVAPVV
ncbi:MAG TPA: FtsX-like permease family protein, partial [Gemmatimonadetes bacterium]|nr:FtsX-like permease family protein [Gemmatimonadota bacterium]